MHPVATIKAYFSQIPRYQGKGMWNRSKYYLTRVLHLDGEASWLAMSFAVGVSISLTPFYGLHTITVIALIPVFRLNVVAALLGSMANPPWIAPFIYGIGFVIGQKLVGLFIQVDSTFPGSLNELVSLMSRWEGFWGVIVPFFIGSTMVSMAVGFAAYLFVKHSILLVRKRNPPGESLGELERHDVELINSIAQTSDDEDHVLVNRVVGSTTE